MEQHDVPVISVSALIPGAINDKDKSGLASLTATALKHGTKNFTKAKLDEDLDFIGANVALMLRRNTRTFLFATKDKDNFIIKVLLNPVFDSI
jgi:predicted Zn-dependent peptidase